MADLKTPDYEAHPVLAELDIPGLFYGKCARFDRWRCVVADMTGTPIRYVIKSRPVQFPNLDPALRVPQTLEFLEAEAEAADAITITPDMRRGFWADTPQEPLLILLFMTVPGGTFQARHAAAISRRLDEIDPVVHAADDGSSTDLHERARAWFARQAISGADVMVSGGFETTGWWDADLAEVYRA
ncbi:hypothetical protein [Pararhizobium sp.]|uniref:hypothetical protein n=1 Tax=Pararhizobium sp. TaxID=1977563 RepID=UPI0027177C3E|nr:hypothetical protein [Pararhizobium sp.]MDO9417503.1 hypothetical protein [Pararhizobium sp.]